MLNIVLYQPEIPPNTGNILRTCYSLDAKLHIIKPISFDLAPKWMKRASAGKSLDDIEHEVHESYENFQKKYGTKKIFYITRYGRRIYSDVDFKKENKNKKEVWIMFGRESTGIPMEILEANIDTCLRIPMTSRSRSLNLANCVSIVAYEVMRQLEFFGLSKYEVQKGENWIMEWHKNGKSK